MEDYYKEKNIKMQKRKFTKKIVIKLLYIITIPIMIWNLIIIVKMIQNPDDNNPSVFGIKTFCIISGSMEPYISINDVVIIKEVSQDEIDVGDIISFTVNEETITHRVKEIEVKDGKRIYTTKGDSNNIEDANKITYEDIEGKYIGKIPKIGKVILALKSKTTLAIVLIVLISIYVIERRADDKKIKRANARIEYEKENKEK